VVGFELNFHIHVYIIYQLFLHIFHFDLKYFNKLQIQAERSCITTHPPLGKTKGPTTCHNIKYNVHSPLCETHFLSPGWHDERLVKSQKWHVCQLVVCLNLKANHKLAWIVSVNIFLYEEHCVKQ
jgi:hypothetical protein